MVLAREAWPNPELIEASQGVVCLAVHRWEQDEDSALRELAPELGASDWAVRLDVMAYPQFRYLDGWGRPLEMGAASAYGRSATHLAEAMREAAQRVPARLEKPVIKVPTSLKRRVPKSLRKDVVDPDPVVRARAWAVVLGAGRLESEDLATLFEVERDPVVRIGVLMSLRAGEPQAQDPSTIEILELAVDGDNDYVRSEAIVQTGDLGGEAAVTILTGVMRRVLHDDSGWSNPNNMLCAATEAAIDLADPGLLGPLAEVVEKTGDNNAAHRHAVKALRAIGERPGMGEVVAEILRRNGYD